MQLRGGGGIPTWDLDTHSVWV